MTFDVILQNGEIYDGTGRPSVKADIGLKKGKIAAIDKLETAEAALKLDCTGCAICPGFIDIHSHSDLTLLQNPRAESKIHMGVTCEAIGQCGLGVFPIRPGTEEQLRAVCSFLEAKVPYQWHSAAEYFHALACACPAVNVAPLVGHSALRAYVVGFANRPATTEEIAHMRELLQECLEQGAIGLSMGLAYPLGRFASCEEILGLFQEAGRHNTLVSVHLRDEGIHGIKALEEIIALAQKAQTKGAFKLQIAHLKCSGKQSWGNMPQLLETIEKARDGGLDIAFDVYPYTAGSRHLSGSLPAWMHDGGPEAFLRRLRDPLCRKQLQEEYVAAQHNPQKANPFELNFSDILITDVRSAKNRWAVGLRLDEIARRRQQEPLEAALDLLAEEEGHVNACFFSMCEEDMRLALSHPLGCVATDGLAFAPYGPLSQGRPHPRSYGTYPRLLGKYVREEKLLSLSEAIRKCTAWPASRIGFYNRGQLQEGMWADIVVFDPERIIDTATYTNPHQYPQGLLYVFVNGILTVQGREHTGAAAGRILQRKRD